MAFFSGGRFRELMRKYGKVAAGVHLSVSGASIAGLYVAIKSNVDVESILQRLPFGGSVGDSPEHAPSPGGGGEPRGANRTAELAASSGGALALAVLCNKALFPIRVPITVALTPPIARFLARRKIIKGGL